MRAKRPDDLDAWDHVQRGLYEHFRYKPESNTRARGHFEQAIAIDPDYAQAHAGLAWNYCASLWLLWSGDRERDLIAAHESAARAIALDERDATAHAAMAFYHYVAGQMEGTVSSGEKSISLNPSRATSHMITGAGYIHGGDPERGIRMMSRAIELSPRDPLISWMYGGRAIGHLLAGSWEEADADAKRGVSIRYGYLFARAISTVAQVELGEVESAKSEYAIIKRLEPEFSMDHLSGYVFTADQREMLRRGLETAGMRPTPQE